MPTDVANSLASGDKTDHRLDCPNCGSIGVVACVNCKGEGITVPVALQRKQIGIPTDEFEMALEEMGIASLAANYVNQQARERLDRELARQAAVIASVESEQQDEAGESAATESSEVEVKEEVEV